MIANYACKATKVPMVTTAHGVYKINAVLKTLTKWGLKSIVVSEDVKQYLMKEYGIKEENISITVNGIDMHKFSKTVDYSDVIEEFKIDKTKKSIVHVSRLDDETSIVANMLIDSAEKYKNAQLIIVGSGTQYENLKNLFFLFNVCYKFITSLHEILIHLCYGYINYITEGKIGSKSPKSSKNKNKLSNEIVFCGYGEPMLKLDILKQVAKYIKDNYPNTIIRVNTNGHANLVYKRNVLSELKGFVDKFSVSLNGENEDIYNNDTYIVQKATKESNYFFSTSTIIISIHYDSRSKNRNIINSLTQTFILCLAFNF